MEWIAFSLAGIALAQVYQQMDRVKKLEVKIEEIEKKISHNNK